jgi:hypothetical protein
MSNNIINDDVLKEVNDVIIKVENIESICHKLFNIIDELEKDKNNLLEALENITKKYYRFMESEYNFNGIGDGDEEYDKAIAAIAKAKCEA